MAETSTSARVEGLIAQMTLEEKCALLTGDTPFTTCAFERLGIPALSFSDGPHGMRHQGEGANHLGIGGSDPATCFPTAVTVANSWDPTLGQELGQALGQEAATMGVGCVLGPGLNIKRSPLCGRNFEYFSEDPYLAGKMAAGYVRGIQGTGVSACPKHFAVNSQETRRQASDSVIDERTMRELYLTGFEIAVTEGRPQTIMTSYNLVNGTYANENAHLLADILRGEWGYEGSVVTDWGGSNDHVAGIAAGSTFEMPGPAPTSVLEAVAAVREGRLSEEALDARVREALTLVLSTSPAVEAARGTAYDAEAHHRLARRIAAQGAVLLKNGEARDGEPLLPLAPGTRVALIGDFAETPRYQGAGSSLVNCTRLDTLRSALEGDAEAHGLVPVGYAQGFQRGGVTTSALVNEATQLAREADVAIVALGLDEVAESEGLDRAGMRLDSSQTQLLAALHDANPNVVVVLHAGSQVETDWLADAGAVLYAALGGQAGASATLDVLTGAVNPSGHLAETWVRHLEDTPTYGRFPSDEFTSEYREGPYVGYRYHQAAGVPVAFPFGFGLSYTTFALSGAQVELGDDGQPTGVSFTVANTGSRAGAQVCQLYVGKPDATVFRPVCELKGFAKVHLEAGASARVTIPLDDKAFRYWNVRTGAWEVEGGTYLLQVGTSCEDLPLSVEVELAGTGAPDPYEGLSLAPYRSGNVASVTREQFAELLGHDVPEGKVELDRNACFRDLTHSRSPLLALVGLVVSQVVKSSEAKGTPNLNALFIHNMPLRALAKNAGGIFSMGVVDALVREAKGWGMAMFAPALLVRRVTGGHLLLTWFVLFAAPIVWELAKAQVSSARLRSQLKGAGK